MASAATVLRFHHLVDTIAEYQHGVHANMWPLVSAENPLKELDICRERAIFFGNGIQKRFASLDAVLTAWYSEWGHGRLFKLFASFPQMQLRAIVHALWSGNLPVLTLLPVEMLREVPSRMVDFAAFSGNTSALKYLHDVVGLNISTRVAMYNAAQCGHLDVVRYLTELNNGTDVGRAALEAAFRGHLGVVEFFHVHCASCSVEDAFLPAIFRQDFVVAQFILNLVGKTIWTSCVQWIAQHRAASWQVCSGCISGGLPARRTRWIERRAVVA